MPSGQHIRVTIDPRRTMGNKVWVDGHEIRVARVVIDGVVRDGLHRVTLELVTDDLHVEPPPESRCAWVSKGDRCILPAEHLGLMSLCAAHKSQAGD